jgi:hypothetical protein
MVLIWCALMMITLLGMVGLIIDAGMCMASQRQAQNAADAAALAAAMDKLLGKTNAQATATAVTFVKQYNQDHAPEVTLDPIVNFPPTSGAYQNVSGYVEAIVKVDVHTFLIQLLPGASSVQRVSARAVAGIEGKSLGEGVGVLDPSARPGLSASGNGILKVIGRVTVNSEGGGVTETGAPINNGNSGVAASVSGSNAGVYATEINVVGGVDSPSGFHNFTTGGPNPLHTGQLPTPDPLRYLPTPIISNGVDPVYRGTPKATNGNLTLNDPSGLNAIQTNPTTGVKTMQLYPGVYGSISITGGNVKLYPGIYVLSPQSASSTTLSITGGTVTANGVMFYNTGSNYNPNTGAPDVNDVGSSPPATGAQFGGVSISSSITMSPIDTGNIAYNYGGYQSGAPVPIADFNGMLFYQRRNSTTGLTVSGNAAQALLTGALYAKNAVANFTGQGTFNAQFIVGSISISGNGIVTINFTGSSDSISKSVFLVE